MPNVTVTTVKSITDEREERAPEGLQKSFICPVTSMEFVFVKGGTFQMGDIFGDGLEDERPAHEITVGDFYIGKYMVTQGEWMKVMSDNPSYNRRGDRFPVEKVSWHAVQEFIGKLNQIKGGKYCLPTEGEWEYAARSGGKKELFSGSDKSDEVSWGNGKYTDNTQPVGLKKANGLGLYDMSGNLSEWCHDFYNKDYYKYSVRNNPIGPDDGVNHVVRGGSWTSNDWNLQVVRRDKSPTGSNMTGFRLAYGGAGWDDTCKKEWERNERQALFLSQRNLFHVSDDVIHDKRTGLMWARNANIAGEKMFWDEAMKWVNKLKFGPYSGWRLPTIEELESLVKREGKFPVEFLSAIGFQIVEGTYLTSSTTGTDGNNNGVWVASLGKACKALYGTNKGVFNGFIWPVRKA